MTENETYFICLKCGTTYRYLLEPVTEAKEHTRCSGCVKHPFAPTCDNCGSPMLATNDSNAVVLLRDARRLASQEGTA